MLVLTHQGLQLVFTLLHVHHPSLPVLLLHRLLLAQQLLLLTLQTGLLVLEGSQLTL